MMGIKHHTEMDSVLTAIKAASEKYNLDTKELSEKIANLEESSAYEQSLLGSGS